MAIQTQVKGLDVLLTRLETARKRIKSRVQVALNRAGVRLLRESNDIVPVQIGNLKASKFVRMREDLARGGIAPTQVGYTAAYAIFVHENLAAAHGRAYNEKHMLRIIKSVDATGKRTSKRKHTARSGNFFRGPDQQAKFLETPFRRLKDQLIRDVQEASKFSTKEVR
jgi:hypothetical protein